MWRFTGPVAELVTELSAALKPLARALLLLPGLAAASSGTSLLAVRLNGVEQTAVVPVLQQPEGLALPAESWAELGLRGGAPLVAEGRRWQRLDPRLLRWRIEGDSQTLVIDAPAGAFSGGPLQATRPAPAASVLPPAGGAFFNYEWLWQRGRPGMPDGGSGLVEGTAFGTLGTLSSAALLRHGGPGPRSVRLDTTYIHDDPDALSSLRLGDSTGSGGAWARPARFGGLHWASDFSLQPGFTAHPLPTLRGEATLPSTVELFVDQSRRVQGTVPAGAFELRDLPVVDGMGELRLVVRDLLGREQVLTLPYHTSPLLLRPGLAAHALELGAERLDWGRTSGHYGRALGAATWREGITEQHTREWRAEFVGHLFAAGVAGAWLLPGVGTLQLATAASHRPGQQGAMASLQLQRPSRHWSAGLNLRASSAGFRQLGQADAAAPRLQAGASFGGHWQGWGLGASLLQQQARTGQRQDLAGLNLGRSFGRLGTLTAAVLLDRASGQRVATLSFSVALDERQTAGAAGTRAGGRQLGSVGWQLAAPAGEGLGAQLTGEHASDSPTRHTAQAQWRLEALALHGAVSQGGSGTDTRVGASGGIGWIGDRPFASRRIDGGFALVQVADLQGVTVLHEHRPVARTDAQGRAWVPGLRGQEVNRIGVDAGDLPLDVVVDALERLVVPPARAGVLIELPLQRSRGAQLRLLAADGRPPPAGSELRWLAAGREQRGVLGFEGRAFLHGLADNNRLQVSWPGGGCVLHFAAPAGSADLGVLACR